MTDHTRGTALKVLGGLTLAPALAGRAAAATTLHVSVIPIFDVAPLYAANAQGYFAKEGLTIDMEPVQGGSVGIPALVSGDYDVVYTNSVSAVLAITKGIDLRIVLAGSLMDSKPPDQGALMMLKGAGFKTGKDLEGKIIGVNAIKSLMWAVDWQWIKESGGDPQKVTFVEIGIPQMLPGLKAKKFDACLVLDPFMTIGMSDPAFEVLAWPFSKVFAGGASAVYVVTGDMVAKHPDQVRAFQRAMRAGAGWVNANLGSPAYIDMVAAYTKVDPNLMKKMPMFPAEPAVSPKGIDILVNLMIETGILDKKPDLSKSIYTG